MAADYDARVQTLITDFMHTPQAAVLTVDFGLDQKVVRKRITSFVRDMLQCEDRKMRQWTRRSVLDMLEREDSPWLNLSVQEWFCANDAIFDFCMYLQMKHCITDANLIGRALDTFTQDNFEVTDAELYKSLASAQTNKNFSPLKSATILADYLGEQPAVTQNLGAFLHRYMSDIILLSEGADGMDILLLTALADNVAEPSPQYIANWVNRNVMPDIDMDQLAQSSTRLYPHQDIVGRRDLERYAQEAFINNPEPLATWPRMMIGARIDGDPLVDTTSLQRYYTRHATVISHFFDRDGDQLTMKPFKTGRSTIDMRQVLASFDAGRPTITNQEHAAKVIDFNSARKEMEKNK
ncbi:hypothetical protein PQ472_01385 [Lacticaseibacillus pabuli]|uniref:Uncharacterized protein n=1 Tax=Lacticaseibacillus pabuli TaxID=3025672 RepID=A0ABY7WRV8_9LACO|nr:hypothetical protein [Lacticaseibacillus sp. KACC 23028]WDF82923.1 hypothetical protein PQ472_01385 [Lacticaseibacillus sp. KACC 23028]